MESQYIMAFLLDLHNIMCSPKVADYNKRQHNIKQYRFNKWIFAVICKNKILYQLLTIKHIDMKYAMQTIIFFLCYVGIHICYAKRNSSEMSVKNKLIKNMTIGDCMVSNACVTNDLMRLKNCTGKTKLFLN